MNIREDCKVSDSTLQNVTSSVEELSQTYLSVAIVSIMHIF